MEDFLTPEVRQEADDAKLKCVIEMHGFPCVVEHEDGNKSVNPDLNDVHFLVPVEELELVRGMFFQYINDMFMLSYLFIHVINHKNGVYYAG